MADYKKLIPFILKVAGGLSHDRNDIASKDPCPFPLPHNGLSGYHTNKDITWFVWKSVFGDTQASANRFFAMSPDDWGVIYKKNFWDKCLGDSINSQRIADTIVDWVWGSGQYYPERDIQELIDNAFNKHLAKDGVFGKETIDTINEVDEEAEYNDLIARRLKFIEDIVAAADAKGDHSQDGFLQGWKNRLNELVEFNKTA